MMMQATTLRWVLGSVSLVGAIALGTPVMAQTTDNLVVQATVESDCSVTGATMDFGSYTGIERDVEIPIEFACTSPTNVTIAMDGGALGEPGDREMTAQGSTTPIKYDLFQESTFSTLWGILPNDAKSFPNAIGGTPSVFGRIPGNQSPSPGNYSDTVLITLTTN